MTRSNLSLLTTALSVVVACTNSEPVAPSPAIAGPSFQLGPADGNGNKNVLIVDFTLPDFTTCPSGEKLTLRIVGWNQERHVDQIPMGIIPHNFDFIYSNAAGDTYTWHQTGAERFYFADNGHLMLSTTGRLGYDGNIGRLLIDITTETLVSISGTHAFAEDLACAALT